MDRMEITYDTSGRMSAEDELMFTQPSNGTPKKVGASQHE